MAGTRPRLLLVDDEPEWLRLLSFQIGNAGWETVCACSGDEGLTLYDAGPDFAAAVLDQRMPGLVGTEVAARLRRRGFEGPIIIFSAHDDPVLRRVSERHGVQVVSKLADTALHRMLAIYRSEIVGPENEDGGLDLALDRCEEDPGARRPLRRLVTAARGGRR